MKTYVYPADTHGCGSYRLIWPTQVLQSQGYDVELILPHERNKYLQGAVHRHENRLVDVVAPEDADVIVFQRISHQFLTDAVPILRGKGIAVVIDMDDDLSAIHPGNPAFHAYHPNNDVYAEHSWRNASISCRRATLVTTSTPALIDRYAPGKERGIVLYNRVPERYLEIPHEDSDLLGWAGSIRSHPNDLQMVGSSIAQLVRGGAQFHVAGPGEFIAEKFGLRDDEITSAGTLDTTDEYPQGVAKIGIGIAPLADTQFNTAKSWLKPLEYSAMGVPWVASPRTEYARLHRDENVGLLARKPNEWLKKLRQLTSDPALREDMSAQCRAAAANHTIEQHAWRWMEAWEAAYEYERGNRPETLTQGSALLRSR